MRKRLLILTVAVSCAAMASAQDGSLLRKLLVENSTETYKVTIGGSQNIEVPGQGPMDIAYKGGYDWIFKYKTIDKTKDVADVDVTVKDLKFEMDGGMMGQGPEMPKEIVSTGKMDGRYRLSELKSQSPNMQMMMTMGAGSAVSPFIELPEKPVKVGDSWEAKLPKNPFLGDVEVKLKATFKGDGKLEDKTGNLIELEGDVPLNVDLSKVLAEMAKSGNDPSGGAMADMKMTMKGAMKVKVSVVLDKASGKALVSIVTVDSNSTMELVDMGMSIPTKGKSTVKLVLQ